jgi:hypothetical protein
MSFIRGGETIQVRRKSLAGHDEWGNPTFTYETITVKDALLSVDGSSAPVDASRDAVDAKISVYLPRNVVIEDEDVLIIRGTEWVMDGTSQKWIPPFAGLDGGQMIPVRQRLG